MKRSFGCLPDLPSSQGSHSLEEVCGSSSGSGSADWSSLCDPPVDQGPTSTCFAHAWASAIAQCIRTRGVQFERPSALLIADMAKGLSGTRGLDVGCSLGAAEMAIRTCGFAPESAVPWRASEVCRGIWADEYQDAIVQVGTRSHRIVSDVRDSIEQALVAGRGLVSALSVDQPFSDCTDEKWEGMTGSRLGGHAMSGCACSDYGVKYVGSYGTSWAKRGFLWIPWGVIESEGCMSNWIVDAAPEYWEAK